MKDYNTSKAYDVVSDKNAEESEVRNEMVAAVYFDSQFLNIKNIHNKGKEHR